MYMTTAQALEASIKHWEKNAAAEAPDEANIGPSGCALCNKFALQEDASGIQCHGCPVRERTKAPGCITSPYVRAKMAWRDWDIKPTKRKRKRAFQEAAKAEVRFLKSLRTGE